MELDEAEKARNYLKERGYNRSVIKKYGLGYSPAAGDKLFKTATDSGINQEYLIEAGLIKPSTRGIGYYDSFRGRLMFPIFNTSGKVIAFAGRILGRKKGAKYINSPQTKVYDKSEVLYGINFAKNEIRKNDEAILVEGYTDVISLHENGIKNVIASSGTSLTPQQLKIMGRYGESLTMIYDSDSAGRRAMKRGINLALEEGLDVKLLELPEGEDPDSFVSQFGKDSFLELKREAEEDFVRYIIHKAQKDGSWEEPSFKKKAIAEALESIAHIRDGVSRETYVQHLNKLTKVGDRALFEELGKKMQDLEEQKTKAKRRLKIKSRRAAESRNEKNSKPNSEKDELQEQQAVHSVQKERPEPAKKPSYEKELIRLMLRYGDEMIDFIGSNCSEIQFEHRKLRAFYRDIIERFKQEKKVSAEIYAQKEHPYPQLTGEIVMEQYGVSDRNKEKTGMEINPDERRFTTAKGALKALKLHFLERQHKRMQQKLKQQKDEERAATIKKMGEIIKHRTKLEKTPLEELFHDPKAASSPIKKKVFEYKMKDERE